MSDDLDLDAIAARCDAATPGPWVAAEYDDASTLGITAVGEFAPLAYLGGEDYANAEFIRARPH